MCFSAVSFQDMLRLGMDFDSLVDSEAFARHSAKRLDRGGAKTPKAMDDAAICMGGAIARLVKACRSQETSGERRSAMVQRAFKRRHWAVNRRRWNHGADKSSLSLQGLLATSHRRHIVTGARVADGLVPPDDARSGVRSSVGAGQ